RYAARARPAALLPGPATRQPRRRAWLRIFVVRCSLPCDPPVGGHSCNGGMIPRDGGILPRFHRERPRQRPAQCLLWPTLRTQVGHLPKSENGMDRPRSRPQQRSECVGACQEKEHPMPRASTLHAAITIGIDMGKSTLHMIGLDSRHRAAREGLARTHRIEAREPATLPPCLIGIEAGMATHYVARELTGLGHDVKQVPATYAKPFRQGHKNDFRDAHAVAEAVQRPTTRFVPAKTDEQLDLQALHRVRSRLVSERTAVINQIRGFLLERGIIVRQGLRFLRQLLPDILAKRADVLSPRIVRIVTELSGDWRRLDERIETVTDEIEALAKSDDSCRRVMTVPGIGPIISSAMVAAIGNGVAFARGRDFSAWLG